MIAVVYTTPEAIAENSKFFSADELRCKGSGKLFIDAAALKLLNELRELWEEPLHVVSAYRSVAHNKHVGGAKNSYHLQGRAFDIAVPQGDQLSFAFKACQVGFTGVILYPRKHFVHVDNRPDPYYDINWS